MAVVQYDRESKLRVVFTTFTQVHKVQRRRWWGWQTIAVYPGPQSALTRYFDEGGR